MPVCVLVLAAITISLAVFFIRSLMPDRCADVGSIEMGELYIIPELIYAVVIENFIVDRDRIFFDIVNNSNQYVYNPQHYNPNRAGAMLEYYCAVDNVWRRRMTWWHASEWESHLRMPPPVAPSESIEFVLYLSDHCPPLLTPGGLYRVRAAASIFDGLWRREVHHVVYEFYGR